MGNAAGVLLDGGQVFTGNTNEVLAKGFALPIDDVWVEELALALERERKWPECDSGWGRRNSLELRRGDGSMYHVSASANRESIFKYGLDWHRMGSTPGVAGSRKPELPGIFLQEHEDDDFFAQMARTATDMWRVNVEGLWIESGPSGWWFVAHPIDPDRLELLPVRYPATD